MAKRIQKMLDGPDFRAFTELARALERGRAPSQKGWRESLPDLEHRVIGIRRRLAELARTVSQAEQEWIRKENPAAIASNAQASRLARVGSFVESLKRNIFNPVSDQADIRYSVEKDRGGTRQCSALHARSPDAHEVPSLAARWLSIRLPR